MKAFVFFHENVHLFYKQLTNKVEKFRIKGLENIPHLSTYFQQFLTLVVRQILDDSSFVFLNRYLPSPYVWEVDQKSGPLGRQQRSRNKQVIDDMIF